MGVFAAWAIFAVWRQSGSVNRHLFPDPSPRGRRVGGMRRGFQAASRPSEKMRVRENGRLAGCRTAVLGGGCAFSFAEARKLAFRLPHGRDFAVCGRLWKPCVRTNPKEGLRRVRSAGAVAAAYELPRADKVERAGKAAPYVHHAGEREDEKEGHAHEDVQFEQEVRVFDVAGRAAPEGYDVLRPLHEFDHFVSVQVPHADKDGGEAEQQGD